MRQNILRFAPWALIAGAAALVVVGLVSTPRSLAQQQVQLECKAAMVIDRSGSVGEPNLVTMREQIRRLFLPTVGLYNDLIQLAFWSFSSTTNRTSNYDAPFNDFVSSRGVDSGFMQNLNALVSAGGTNYEQGFAYDRGTPNTYDNMEDIVGESDIIVFMTDGVPNTPGVGDNNATARNAARNAVVQHKANGKIVVGGILGNVSQTSLNFVINGSNGDGTDIFRISTDYTDLAEKLREVIQRKCSELLPPSDDDYSLTPRVETDDQVASGEGSVTFRYSVNNNSDGSSRQTNWSIKRVLVARGQSAAPLLFSSPAYRDGYSCAQLEALVNNQGTCTDVTDGSRIYGPGGNDMSLDVGGAATVVMDDSWQVGTKLCFVLTLDPPTDGANPRNRYSRAACTTIGKRPFVQIHGGDIKVGRYFVDDTLPEDEDDLRANVVGYTTAKSDNNTYGSWAEYAIFTTGTVSGFGTMSGFADGFPTAQFNNQSLWSSLTFANSDNELGRFTDFAGTLGNIPDVSTAILAGRNVVEDLSGQSSVDFSGNLQSGLYRKESGNIELASSSIAQNKTYVLHVPEGTVRISGNIGYNDGPYDDIRDIPQLIIIAQNIVIDENVENVDAWLIAQGGGQEDGVVNTCNTEDTLTSQICNDLLTINGPVMARTIELRRTGGAGAGNAAGDPAEIINLPADSYLWSHTEGRSDLRVQTTYTVELPPYF